MIEGKAIKFGDNIDTDQIIGSQYLSIGTIKEMSNYTFENYENFKDNFMGGDIIVGGENFGCGSSREQAPAVLKEKGVSAIIAKSFARIFYRNSINLGILLIENKNTDEIDELDSIHIDINEGVIRNKTKNKIYTIKPLPEFVLNILNSGGLVNYMKNKQKR